MREYLENPICKLKPLFKIDYRKKQNIVSACFFKMYGGGYKNFSKYTEGIVKLSKTIERKIEGFRLRLFIEKSIYEDDNIMKILNKLDIDLVLYECQDFIKEDKYHVGLFGTLLRFFPLFDFPNNDSNMVIVSDIDIGNTDVNTILTLYKNFKRSEKFMKKVPFTIYYHSTFYKTANRTKHTNIYNNYIYNYLIADSLAGFKKMNKNIIIKFLQSVEKYDKDLTFYKGKKIQQDTNFIFGVDEYFTSEILKKYIIDRKKTFVQNITHITTGYLYNVIMFDKIFKKEYKNFLNFVLKGFKNYPKGDILKGFR